MADELIAHLKMQSETEPRQPFLISYVPGSTHAPHHLPKPPAFIPPSGAGESAQPAQPGAAD